MVPTIGNLLDDRLYPRGCIRGGRNTHSEIRPGKPKLGRPATDVTEFPAL